MHCADIREGRKTEDGRGANKRNVEKKGEVGKRDKRVSLQSICRNLQIFYLKLGIYTCTCLGSYLQCGKRKPLIVFFILLERFGYNGHVHFLIYLPCVCGLQVSSWRDFMKTRKKVRNWS